MKQALAWAEAQVEGTGDEVTVVESPKQTRLRRPRFKRVERGQSGLKEGARTMTSRLQKGDRRMAAPRAP